MKLFSRTGVAGFVVGAVAALGVANGSEAAREYYLERQYADGIRKAEEFKVAVRSCSDSEATSDFSENEYCKKALRLLASGPMTVSDKGAFELFQHRMMFYQTYSDWLECQAGTSVIRRIGCGKKLNYIEMLD